jgi:hypothetical protein
MIWQEAAKMKWQQSNSLRWKAIFSLFLIALIGFGGMAHSSQESAPPKGEPSDMGAMVMDRDNQTHVTETMSSHQMHMGPHMKMTDLRPENAEDAKKADEIVKILQADLKKYTDYHVAIADGFRPFLPNVPQPEYHFTNYKYGLWAAFKFNPEYPTSLLYRKTTDGYELVGAMYTAPAAVLLDKLNARVPLSVARWHLHVNICLPPRGQAQDSDWTKFGPKGSISTEEACTAAEGRFFPHLFGWMVHVYPFEKSSENIWSH